jgi:hypothetical protein
MLDEIAKVIKINAHNIPDIKKALGVPGEQPLSNPFEIDQTNKNPVGKILVDIYSINHFPYS